MLLSDLEPLNCILDTLVPEEECRYINNNYETQMVETCLHLMYEYISENPTSISDPDFEENIMNDIKELIILHFENDIFYNDNADDEIDEIIDISLSLFYEHFIPRRSETDRHEIKRSSKEIKIIEKKIKELSEKEQPEQRTPEWYNFRHNLITASNAYKAFDNQTTQNQLIYEKCQPVNLFQPETDIFQQVNTNTTLHWGQKYEPLSVMIYEDKYNTKVGDFGCIQHNQYLFLGASPDGINVDKKSSIYGRMLEIKNIVNREINGNPKKEYWIQMQLQMETCDLDECDFLETKFVEYETFNDYQMDLGLEEGEQGEISKIKEGFLKGIIIHFQTKEGKPFYAYKPLNLFSNEEIEEWEQQIIDHYQSNEYGYIFLKFIYWKLEEISCVLVLRNKKWFKDNIEQLQIIWKTIEEERKTGYLHRAPNKRIKKEENSNSNDSSNNLQNGCFLNIQSEKNKINVIKIRTESFDETKANMI